MAHSEAATIPAVTLTAMMASIEETGKKTVGPALNIPAQFIKTSISENAKAWDKNQYLYFQN